MFEWYSVANIPPIQYRNNRRVGPRGPSAAERELQRLMQQDDNLRDSWMREMDNNSSLSNPNGITNAGLIRAMRATYGPDDSIILSQQIWGAACQEWNQAGNEGDIPIDGAGEARNILVRKIMAMASPMNFSDLNMWLVRITRCNDIVRLVSENRFHFSDLEYPIEHWFAMADYCFGIQQNNNSVVNAGLDSMASLGILEPDHQN